MKKAAEILARMLDEKNRKLAKRYSSIFGSWEQIVGQSLAEHSRIYEIANRNLFVEVDHPGWMQLLMMKKTQILKAVRRKAPALDVKDIRVKVNLHYSNTVPEEEESPVSQNARQDKAAGEQREDIDRILSSVSQEELKRRLRGLFEKSLENEKSNRG